MCINANKIIRCNEFMAYNVAYIIALRVKELSIDFSKILNSH